MLLKFDIYVVIIRLWHLTESHAFMGSPSQASSLAKIRNSMEKIAAQIVSKFGFVESH